MERILFWPAGSVCFSIVANFQIPKQALYSLLENKIAVFCLLGFMVGKSEREGRDFVGNNRDHSSNLSRSVFYLNAGTDFLNTRNLLRRIFS